MIVLRLIHSAHPCLLALVLAWAACGDDGAAAEPDAAQQPPQPDAMVATPDAATPDAAPPDAHIPAVDCANLPPVSTQINTISQVPGSEDFTFDASGNLVNIQIGGGGLFRTPYAGQPQVGGAGLSSFARGQRLVPGGDLVFADPDTNTLKRVDSTGAVRIVLSGLPDPNGVAIGADGFVYLTHGGGQVRRINPDTGAFTLLVSDPLRSFDGITFSPDYRTLYFNEENGQVNQIPIDENGNAGAESVLTTLPINFLLDGMTTDECGNIYVVEMAGLIWRVTPEGASQVLINYSTMVPNGLIPATNFGSGIGGWRADALYTMDFDGGVYEVDIGVRGKPEPGLGVTQ